jgi:protein O-GlcNAc transferase
MLQDKQQLIILIQNAFSEKDWNELNSVSLMMTCKYPEEMLGWSALGASLSFLNRNQEAISPMEKAVELSPSNVVALINLALALQDVEQYSYSKEVIDRAIKIDKNYSASFNALGRYHKKIGNTEDAKFYFNKSIRMQPLSVDAYSNLGNLYVELGRISVGIEVYQAAINLGIDNAELKNNLGIALMLSGKYENAEIIFKDIIKNRPNYSKAKVNYGSCLYNQCKYEEAIDFLQLAIREDETNSEAYCNLGLALAALKKTKEAIEIFQKAIEINPFNAESFSCLAGVLKSIGRNEEACQQYRKALTLKIDNNNIIFSNYLFCMLHNENITKEELFNIHKEYSQRYEKKLDKDIIFPNSKNMDRELRIGFVSGDLYHHAVSSFAIPYITGLNKDKFRVYIYSNTIINDEVTDFYKNNIHKWSDVVSLCDIELLELIKEDRIDILIDLSGHTGRNRMLVFAKRAAPVQATWIGYPYTTGLNGIDYYFTDKYIAPPGLYEKYWTEKFIWMPSAGVFRPELNSPPVAPLPAVNNGFLTFGSFNRFEKINNEVVDIWGQILRELPNSKLLIANIDNPIAREKLIYDLNVDPMRIKFHGRLQIIDYLKLHNEIDIHLDSWPYPGATTTLHSAWMGVPTITFRGETLLSNLGAAIMGKIGYNEFIANNINEYISIAKYYSSNVQELIKIRTELRMKMHNSKICDMKLNIASFQYGLIAIWQRWCTSENKTNIEIQKIGEDNWVAHYIN